MPKQKMRIDKQEAQRQSAGLKDYMEMKVNKNGEIVIPAALVEAFGFQQGDSVKVEVSRNGINVKSNAEPPESIMKWLREEHGDEMATLTTDQILHLLK